LCSALRSKENVVAEMADENFQPDQSEKSEAEAKHNAEAAEVVAKRKAKEQERKAQVLAQMQRANAKAKAKAKREGPAKVVELEPKRKAKAKAKAKIEEPKGEDEAPAATELGPEEVKRRQGIRRLTLEWINGRCAVIRSFGGKCVVVTEGRSSIDPNKKNFVFQSREAFEQWMANKFIPSLEKKNKNEAVGPWWWRHPNRRQFDGVVFEPLKPDVVETAKGQSLFNTYLGWGVEPKKGDWSLMRRHIKEVLADNDPKADDYIVRWTAWSVQHPDQLPLVALVLIGKKGRGKGAFARVLERIFGDHSLQISNQRHIVGNFNAHLENLVLMISDEAYWAGHKADAGTLQRMITEPTLAIEAKGFDVRNVRNHIHLLMLGEPGWSVPAGQDERRYAVFGVSEEVHDEKYFKALYKEIEGDGPAAMLWDLQQMELGDWHPRQIHRTEALRHQQDLSLPALEEWLLGLLEDGRLPCPVAVDKAWASTPSSLLGDAKQKFLKLRDLSFNRLADFLTEWGCQRAGGGHREWRFPALKEMRTDWDRKYVPRQWSRVEDWGCSAKPTMEEILECRLEDLIG
jgi:hypothetical protein